MVKNSNVKKPHTTMRGKTIDMDLLRKKNELTPAVGNARVNARGDELGPGGKIVRKREDIVKEYYESNPNAVKTDAGTQPTVTPPTVQSAPVEEKPKPATKTTTKKNNSKDELAEDWEEDEDGNFTKKGDK
jgi:hypothetical protein